MLNLLVLEDIDAQRLRLHCSDEKKRPSSDANQKSSQLLDRAPSVSQEGVREHTYELPQVYTINM